MTNRKTHYILASSWMHRCVCTHTTGTYITQYSYLLHIYIHILQNKDWRDGSTKRAKEFTSHHHSTVSPAKNKQQQQKQSPRETEHPGQAVVFSFVVVQLLMLSLNRPACPRAPSACTILPPTTSSLLDLLCLWTGKRWIFASRKSLWLVPPQSGKRDGFWRAEREDTEKLAGDRSKERWVEKGEVGERWIPRKRH